jgi:hypothetical protein
VPADRNVVKMVLFYVRGRFDLNETPAPVAPSMQNIDAHQNAIVLKRAFKDRWDVSVSDYLTRGADRLIQASLAANFDATRKHLPGEHADLSSLLDDRVYGTVRLNCEFWLVNLQVEPLEALAPCNKP